MQPVTKIMCVVPVTRYWALNHLGESLKKLQVPDDVELTYYFYVDSPDPRIKNGLHYWTEQLPQVCAVQYSGNPEPSSTRIALRRERIVAMHKALASVVAGSSVDYVFGIEDDTILPEYALSRLWRFIKGKANVGLVQGVQCGRWGYKMVGAWRVDDINDPSIVLTMPYIAVNREHSFMEQIDGGGMYCYLTPARLFAEADYRVEGVCLGVDMLYGLDLRRQGYENYIDWSVVCPHNDFGVLITPDSGKPMEQLIYRKNGDEWDMEVRPPRNK